MKTIAIQIITVLMLGTGVVFAQDIPQSQVPTEVVNSFNKEFPKANDIEWEKKGNQYNVEFEIGWFTDYEAWFNSDGKMIRYSKEISDSDLPKKVENTIKTQFQNYRIDDVTQFTENGVNTFKVELEKGEEEIDVLFSNDGKVISK